MSTPLAIPPAERATSLQPNLVLGIIENYHFAQLEPFLVSLRQTGYKGDIVFFHHRIDRRCQEEIHRFGVKLIPFRNVRESARGPARPLLDQLSLWYHRAKWPFYSKGWYRLLSAARLRYRLYHRFLREQGRAYDRVLLTDTRDVYFQSEPFHRAPSEDLIFLKKPSPPLRQD